MIAGTRLVQSEPFWGLGPVVHVIGLVLLATAGMMLFPLIADLAYGNADWTAFAWSAAVAGVMGAAATASSRGSLRAGLTVRQAFLLTPLTWFSVATVSAAPFFLSDFGSVSRSLPDADRKSVV